MIGPLRLRPPASSNLRLLHDRLKDHVQTFEDIWTHNRTNVIYITEDWEVVE